MKAYWFLVITLTVSVRSINAATITAIANGNWTSASTWSLNRTPENNDNVVIPFGRTVFFQNTPYSKSDVVSRPTLRIDIWGTLDFSNAGNDKLYLDVGSIIQIHLLGKIQTSSSSSEIIAIYNGNDDNTVWNGSPSTVNGPKTATGTSAGFQLAILPIKLDYFELLDKGRNMIEVIWQTSEESNTSHFEIQRMEIGSNDWSMIGKVSAAGNSSEKIRYKFLFGPVKGVNHFRLKQVDIDGKFTYSIVKTIKVGSETVEVHYTRNSHTVALRAPSQRIFIISIYDVFGRMVQQQHLPPYQTLQVDQSLTGIFIVSINSKEGVQYSTKFIR